ncbi:hypothetical protein [Methanobrevibacter sp.]|uniref:hypothetical protein n=1 Tax=Methanobrevibacter sp. TaxID=66852 RepID=UPI0026001052|nr:hypothetical protein [Methanobrevibacter sp.]MBQ6511472.1 hypothetical protein [Methanobrevibacter sp.]
MCIVNVLFGDYGEKYQVFITRYQKELNIQDNMDSVCIIGIGYLIRPKGCLNRWGWILRIKSTIMNGNRL